MESSALTPKPVVPFLKGAATVESSYLEALGCERCGKLFLDSRRHCAACGARDAMQPKRLQQTGSLHAFTIVYRSFPGVKVPYVSAIVDLDGGGTVKGNLLETAPDPRAIEIGMRVRLRYALIDRGPGANGEPRPPILTYAFIPEGTSP
jgi:uncharacterized protein